jgi:hypothetical protein
VTWRDTSKTTTATTTTTSELTRVALLNGVRKATRARQSTWEARIPDVGVVLTGGSAVGRHHEDAAHAEAGTSSYSILRDSL